MATPITTSGLQKKPTLALWMERVLEECDKASVDFAPDPVHDLRVALRRCRSVADGLMAIDPDQAWKQMKRSGRQLFRSLGELRDTHIMQEWVHKLDQSVDPAATVLLRHLEEHEAQFKEQAKQALDEFDRKQWRRWSKSLPRRAARLKTGSVVFKHLALERWVEARNLHRRALRDRSQTAFHNLRIGIKRFRYIVENFLPQQHQAWKDDLKELQDLLGDVHDLDVLWNTAVQLNVFPDEGSRPRWHARIEEERSQRLEKYRLKMVGANSLWPVWRSELPTGDQINAAAEKRLRFWAASLDPDFKHSEQVARLALQLLDGLGATRHRFSPTQYDTRRVLRMAALLHDVGLAEDHKAHHKSTYRLIRKLASPLGWSRHDLDLVAAVARYHRGPLPWGRQKTLADLSAEDRRSVQQLAAVLRLANALGSAGDGQVTNLRVLEKDGGLVVAATNYSAHTRAAESIAAARHLLELVCRCPVIVRRQPAKKGPKASRVSSSGAKTQPPSSITKQNVP